MKEKLKVNEARLRECLQREYGIIPSALEFIPLGLDYNAATYRMVSGGNTYFIKIKADPLNEPSYQVPRYLADRDVQDVIAPVPTRKNALWHGLEEGRLAVYPFIKGVTGWEGMSDAHWKKAGAVLKQIHTMEPSSFPFAPLRKETFDPSDYAQFIRDFESHPVYSQKSEDENVNFVVSTWKEHRSTIHTAMDSLEKFAASLQKSNLPLVLCHADLHPGNLLRDDDDGVFVIDWDDVMLAPKERDFIFIRKPYAEAFFEGYGQKDINQKALAYFLWERLVQDLIYCTKNVCFRADGNKEVSAASAKSFNKLLMDEGATLSMARAVTRALDLPDSGRKGAEFKL